MKTAITTSGIEFTVDDEDAFFLRLNWNAQFQKNGKLGAIVTCLKGSDSKWHTYSLHRSIMKQSRGNGLVVDHIDGNPANNCRSNLRVCTQGENTRNKARSSNNTSGFKGVSWDMQHRKWKADIMCKNKHIHLGYFDTPEAAHEAYCQATKKYHGEFARTE